MIRAAAKNHAAVTVVVEPEDYARVLADMAAARRRHDAGAAQGARRQGLRAHRGLRCGDRRLVREHARRARAAAWRAFGGSLAQELRYGENPHQRAAFYRDRASAAPASPPPCSTRARSSPTTTSATPTPPSSWWPSSIPSVSPAVAIIKHANPCGVALGRDAGGGLRQGAALRSRERVRRHHRAQPPDRRGDGARDHRHLHRGRDRA